MFDRAADERLLDRVGAELDQVEAALGRLDDGTYGRCMECGAPIEEGRLALDPLQSRCDDHEASGSAPERPRTDTPLLKGPVGVLAAGQTLPLGGQVGEG